MIAEIQRIADEQGALALQIGEALGAPVYGARDQES